MSVFSERLKALRIKNQVTQKEIAEYLNIKTNAYQNYEYGKREPNIDNLIKISNYLNVSADYLLGISDDTTRR